MRQCVRLGLPISWLTMLRGRASQSRISGRSMRFQPSPHGSEAAPASNGALLFERHPEYPGSVRGHLKRSTDGNDTQALVSGDVVDGEFNLDESADGVTMDAVWAGAPLDCGLTLRGIRRPAEGRLAGQPSLYFRLQKTPGWR